MDFLWWCIKGFFGIVICGGALVVVVLGFCFLAFSDGKENLIAQNDDERDSKISTGQFLFAFFLFIICFIFVAFMFMAR